MDPNAKLTGGDYIVMVKRLAAAEERAADLQRDRDTWRNQHAEAELAHSTAVLERDEARAAYQRLLGTAAAATKVAEAAATWWRGELETSELESRLRSLLGDGSPKHNLCPDCPLL